MFSQSVLIYLKNKGEFLESSKLFEIDNLNRSNILTVDEKKQLNINMDENAFFVDPKKIKTLSYNELLKLLSTIVLDTDSGDNIAQIMSAITNYTFSYNIQYDLWKDDSNQYESGKYFDQDELISIVKKLDYENQELAEIIEKYGNYRCIYTDDEFFDVFPKSEKI